MIHIVDLATGKALENTIAHSTEIVEVAINQYGLPTQRKIAFIDKNQDLYISYVQKQRTEKIGSIVNSAMWNDKSDLLAAIVDGNFVVWLHPNSLFFDKEISSIARIFKESRF